MIKKRIQIKTPSGVPLSLQDVRELTFLFKKEDESFLKITRYDVLSSQRGIIEIRMTQREVDSLDLNENNFHGTILFYDGKIKKVNFFNGINLGTGVSGQKSW